MKTFLRVIFSCILSLFLAIACFAGGVCHLGQTVICTPDPLLYAAENGGAAQELYDEILYDWENLVAIAGVDEPEPMLSLLTQERVRQDLLQYVRDSYNGTPTINTDDLRSQLDEKVREYAYCHNISATPESELEQNIADLVDACIADYRDAIRIPLLPTLFGKLAAVAPHFSTALLLCIIGAIIFLLFLFFLQKKKQHTLYYACLSVATGGVVLHGTTSLINHYDILHRLPFTDSAIKTLVVSYLENILVALERHGSAFFLTALLALGLYILCCVIPALIRTTKKPVDATK